MDRLPTALTLVALLLAAALPAALAQGNLVTLAAGACQGVTFNNVGSAFNYSGELDTVVLPAGCNQASVGVTKMYTKNACADARNNSFTANEDGCIPVVNNTQATCELVFKTGPQDAILTAGLYSAPQVFNESVFEQDMIGCYNTTQAYFFVWNNCTAPLTVGFELIVSPDTSSSCYIAAAKGAGLIEESDLAHEAEEDNGKDDDDNATASTDAVDDDDNATADDDDDKDDKGSGLSAGAKAGIAIAVIVVVAAIVGIVVSCCCLGKGGK